MSTNAPSPPLYTYALLDCAAYDEAWSVLGQRFPHARHLSLFADSPEAALVSASPLLIALDGDAGAEHGENNGPLRHWLRALEPTAPGISWIGSDNSLPVLASMLARRLACTIDDGQQAILRFFDPRILLGLPSALTATQRRWFFAPVRHWTAWEARRQQHYGIDPEPAHADDLARFAVMPLMLDQHQRERLLYFDKEVLYESIVAHWQASCPESIADIKPVMLREIAIAAVARCAAYGIDQAESLRLFAGLMMTVSPSFDAHPAVQPYLRDERVAPGARLDAMIAGLTDAVWHELGANQRMDALFEHTLPS